MQAMKRDWLKIAEYISLAGAVVGTIAAILLEAVIYGAVLLFLSLWLNLMLRYRWHQINQAQIIHTTIILENLLTEIRDRVAQRVEQIKTEIAQVDRSAENQASHEDIDHLIVAIAQVQVELNTLDESVIPLKETLETLITTVKNYSVSPQQFADWQEKLADILTGVEARSLSSEAFAAVTKLHQEIDHWVTELKQMRAIAPASVPESAPPETSSSSSPSSPSLSESDRQTVQPSDIEASQSELLRENLPHPQTFQPSTDRDLADRELSDSELSASASDDRLNQEHDLNSDSDRADPNPECLSKSGEKTWQPENWETAEILAEPENPEQTSPQHLALTQREPDGEPETSQLVAKGGAFSHYPQPIWQGYEPPPESQAFAFSQFSDPLTLFTTEPTPHLDLSHTNLSGVSLTGANLAGATLIQSNLSETDLRGADLRGADLRGADLSGANLDRADLEAANLAGANLIRVNLRTADLTNANLSAANLSGQNLMGLNLSNINLSGANLQGANLAATNLSGTQLIATNLNHANLTEANLEFANLHRANLTGAQIHQANFGAGDTQANLTGAIMPDGTHHD